MRFLVSWTISINTGAIFELSGWEWGSWFKRKFQFQHTNIDTDINFQCKKGPKDSLYICLNQSLNSRPKLTKSIWKIYQTFYLPFQPSCFVLSAYPSILYLFLKFHPLALEKSPFWCFSNPPLFRATLTEIRNATP